MNILLFIMILILYGTYVYNKGNNFISFFWLIAYSFAFLLPIYLDVFDNFGYILSNNIYDRLNWYYLIGLITFVFVNFITHFLNKNKSENIDRCITLLNVKKIIKIYILITIIITIFLGTEVMMKGTSALLHIHPIITMLLPSTIYGAIFTSGLMFILSDTKRDKNISLFIFICMIFFGLTFTFGRRIVIFPVISLFILYFIKRNKKPKLIYIVGSVIIGIVFILPLMMSIRTFGLVNALPKLIEMYTTNKHLLDEFIAMSTDVNAEYSLAALIIAIDLRTTPLILLKPILMFIPRSIWPDKPFPLSEYLVKNLQLSDIEHMSIPPGIIGESYTYFGIIGIIVMGIFWGGITGIFDKGIYFIKKNNENYISIKSIMITTFGVQFITGAIRGDTATTIQESMYLFIPFLILLIISRYKFTVGGKV
ncbi:oligosaccharide repeat unit polymerase [Macrococcoides canis]|uniref:O-antigen polymerase n=1 Tax=Macrococcoides canis TaxID=1855823 RepID=UPI001F1D1986|nr:O-antigen polymerase [Macrococcus canis]UJS28630.1 oligosaccharide repeat unit polymerase [Macrococcus canis]